MEKLQPLFTSNQECHICSKSFTTSKVRSKFVKTISYDSDFCPNYKEDSVNGLFYNIFVCPDCGYSFSSDFSKYFPPNTKELIEEKIRSQWVPRDFSGERNINEAIQTYKLATYSAILKKEKHVIIAGLYLRTAWLYRMMANEEQEQRFMKLASTEYNHSYSIGDYKGTQISEVKLLYLLGELARRTGHIDESIRYLSKVIEQRKTTVEKNIIDMTIEKWQEIREQQKVANKLTNK